VAFVCQCFDTVDWASGRAATCKKLSDEVLGGANDLLLFASALTLLIGHQEELMPLPPHHLLLH